jgi:hypothetical protein
MQSPCGKWMGAHAVPMCMRVREMERAQVVPTYTWVCAIELLAARCFPRARMTEEAQASGRACPSNLPDASISLA